MLVVLADTTQLP